MSKTRRANGKPPRSPTPPPRPAPTRRQKILLGVAVACMTIWLIILVVLAAL